MRARTAATAGDWKQTLGWANRPVLGDPLMKNCLTCHVPRDADSHDDFFLHYFSGAPEGVSPGRTDPLGARGNFGPISRGLCAECHAAGRERNDCLTCHVYHPGVHEAHGVRQPALPDVPPGPR